MASLTHFDTEYDRFLQGDSSALSLEQYDGLQLFRRHCTSCHTEPHLSHYGYEQNGLPTNDDYGRTLITTAIADSGKFKVPPLRGVALTPPYMHDGSYTTLEEVVAAYAMHRGLDLSPADQAKLVGFLNALD